jgi:hypothetical protein
MVKKPAVSKFNGSQSIYSGNFETAFIANDKIPRGFIVHRQKVIFAGF